MGARWLSCRVTAHYPLQSAENTRSGSAGREQGGQRGGDIGKGADRLTGAAAELGQPRGRVDRLLVRPKARRRRRRGQRVQDVEAVDSGQRGGRIAAGRAQAI